jgi:hypothetical protein
MIENVNEQTANSSQPGTISQKSGEEKIETSAGDPRHPSADLLGEGEHFLEELEGEAPCSDFTIEDAVELLQKLEIGTDNFDQSSGQIALQQGKILNALKKQLQMKSKKKRFGWARWAQAKVKFIGKRKMQNLMYLAEKTPSYSYAALGVERLLKLLRVTKDRNETDPVTSFFLEHGIPIPENGVPLSVGIKATVDDAIAAFKASQTDENPVSQTILKFHREAKKVENAITSILKTPELVEQVDNEKVTTLKNKLAELESLIRPN